MARIDPVDLETVGPLPIGRVMSVNVGRPRQVRWHDRVVTTAIWKQPVSGRVRATGVNLDGDDQADRRVHGGPTKAIYAYATEDHAWWGEQLGVSLEPGTFGENLTIAGVDVSAVVVGERWRIGNTTLRVTEPRIPCFKLGIRMGDASFVDRFADAARPGTYLAIEDPGEVGAGDVIERLHRPSHGVTIGAVERTYHGNTALLPTLADLADLSEGWRSWARRHLARHPVTEEPAT
ncbi:MAG: MOSC domain-containing protein [Acidimicrobiia bacterium]